MLNWCTDCPYYDKENDFCKEDLHRDALNLINRQQAEHERLKDLLNKSVAKAISQTEMLVKRAKVTAIEDFEYSLKSTIARIDFESWYDYGEVLNCIETTAERMAGADDDT